MKLSYTPSFFVCLSFMFLQWLIDKFHKLCDWFHIQSSKDNQRYSYFHNIMSIQSLDLWQNNARLVSYPIRIRKVIINILLFTNNSSNLIYKKSVVNAWPPLEVLLTGKYYCNTYHSNVNKNYIAMSSIIGLWIMKYV